MLYTEQIWEINQTTVCVTVLAAEKIIYKILAVQKNSIIKSFVNLYTIWTYEKKIIISLSKLNILF